MSKRNKDFGKFAEKHAAEVKKHGEALAETKSELDKARSDISDLAARMLESEQKGARRPGAEPETKSLGERVTGSAEFKSFVGGGARGTGRIEVKAITSAPGSAGSLVAPDRQTAPIMLPHRPMTVRQLLQPGRTGSNLIYFVRQSGFTNNAAPVAEGAQKPESVIVFTPDTAQRGGQGTCAADRARPEPSTPAAGAAPARRHVAPVHGRDPAQQRQRHAAERVVGGARLEGRAGPRRGRQDRRAWQGEALAAPVHPQGRNGHGGLPAARRGRGRVERGRVARQEPADDRGRHRRAGARRVSRAARGPGRRLRLLGLGSGRHRASDAVCRRINGASRHPAPLVNGKSERHPPCRQQTAS